MEVFVAIVHRLANVDGAELDHSAVLVFIQFIHDRCDKILIPRLVVHGIGIETIIISVSLLQIICLTDHFNWFWCYLVVCTRRLKIIFSELLLDLMANICKFEE